MERRQSFYDELNGVWDVHSTDDLIICLGSFNGHVSRHYDGIIVNVGYVVGQWNFGEESC